MSESISAGPVSYSMQSHPSNGTGSNLEQPRNESYTSLHIGSKIERAEKGIVEDPYNVESWVVLMKETSNMMEEDARKIFERLVNQFPTCGKYWKIYIDFEIKLQNYELVEKLFQRCLTKVLNLELWKSYLSYVRETKNNLPNFKENMASAYDFALEKVGTDIMAYTIWNDYLIFLKGIEAQGTYAENQKITAVRRIYQRGCATPLINVDTLWKEYNNFENRVNSQLGKKIIEEKTRDYIAARKVAKEYEALTRHLVRNAPAVPPGHRSGLAAAGIAEERAQLEHWRRYFRWEKENPLKSEDYLFISKRVMYAYEQCLLVFGHHPDVWCEACVWLENVSRILQQKGDAANSKSFADAVANLYERAISHLMKYNHLMYFAYADYEESRMKLTKVHQIYERALAVEELDPTLVYIQYMKFARRAEGIKSARAVFKQAREDKRSGAYIYVVAALIEFYCSKDQNVAYKIFEVGLRKHQNDTAYISAYLDFLSHLNEQNNTRVLFEKALSSKSPEMCLEMWENYIAFESLCGDLASIQKVEKKRMSTYPDVFEGREAKMLIDRYKFLDLIPVSEAQLRAMHYQTALPHLQKKFKNIGSLSSSSTSGAAGLSVGGLATNSTLFADENLSKSQLYPLPDTTQMIPFKPNRNPVPNSLPVPGGDFPVPPAAQNLLRRLPPPTCFQGPFVIIDEFLKQMLEIELPEAPQSLLDGSRPGGQVGLKRALMMEEEDSDDEDSSAAARGRKMGGSSSMGIGGSSAMNFSMRGTRGGMMTSGDSSPSTLTDVYRQRQQLKTTPFGANNASK